MVRENIIATKYSSDGEYRFEIIERKDGTFQVLVLQKVYDEYMGEDWFGWARLLRDGVHLADTVERAFEIGDEVLKGLI